MSITDELRTYARGYELTVNHKLLKIADRIDEEHEAKVSYWQDACYKDGYDDGLATADDCLAKNELEKAEKRVSDLEDEIARLDAVIDALRAKNERLKSMVQLFGTY